MEIFKTKVLAKLSISQPVKDKSRGCISLSLSFTFSRGKMKGDP